LFAEKAENFVRQKIKSDTKFCKKYKTYYAVCSKISASFSTIQKNKKNLVYKKETSRKKRALTEYKAADQNTTTICQQHAETAETRVQQIYNKLLQKKVLEEKTAAKEIQKTNYKSEYN